MTRRPGQWPAILLVVTLLVLSSGCTIGDDDEMVQPSRTVTASPSPARTAAPTTLPVGQGTVSPADVVWAQGTRLHVGLRSVDLSPVGVDAFVVVPGGVYVLSGGELWFTDLGRLKGTGLTGVTGLGVTADASRILVTAPDTGTGSPYAYDTGTGRAVSSDGVTPVSAEERLRGRDRSGVDVPEGFQLAGWSAPTRFYGVAGGGGRRAAVVSCDVGTRKCTRLGAVEESPPVVFGSGK